MSSLHRVTDTAPQHVNGARVKPGDLLVLSQAEALYERDLGHVEPTTFEAEAQPIDLTDAEREALPPLPPLGDGLVEYATGQVRWGGGADEPMTAIPAEPDDAGDSAGRLHAE